MSVQAGGSTHGLQNAKLTDKCVSAARTQSVCAFTYMCVAGVSKPPFWGTKDCQS